MIRSFYSAIMWALQPFLRRKLMQRARQEPGYALHIEQRFGVYEGVTQPPKPCVWVHAVSLGESRAAAMLLKALRQHMPSLSFVFTHGTATGREQGLALLSAGDVSVWQPWDTPAAVERFLTYFQPQVALLLETEVWPNWVQACQTHHIPMLLVNARMSEKSQRQAQRLSWLSRPAYQGLSGVLAQTDDDAQRLATLGAKVLAVTGNLKFDAQPQAQQLALAHSWKSQWQRPVVMLASSREGEESMWLDALAGLSAATREQVQWLIVPRHPQRFDDVEQLILSAGWSISRRSQWRERGPSSDQQTKTCMWLGDSLGDMALYYGLADVALLGGSFAPLGGQNLIEAAACGCPVVMGAHTFNFEQAAELALGEGAALRVGDMQVGVSQALSLVLDTARQQAMSRAGVAFCQKHRGAAAQTLQALAPFLGCQ